MDGVAEMAARLQRLENSINSFVDRLSDTEDDVAVLKTTKADNERVNNLDTKMASMETKMAAMESKMASVEHRMAKLELSVTSQNNRQARCVAFTANGEGGAGLKKTGETLVFGHVLLNTGSGYDAASGVFTSPLSGLYTFTASVEGVYAILTVDAWITSHSGDFAMMQGPSTSTGSASATVHLTANSQVWVKAKVRKWFNHGENHFTPASSFSGFLVAADEKQRHDATSHDVKSRDVNSE